jgi:hypothetical protein
MSIQTRSSDAIPGKRYFRSADRVFRQSDGWYYSAREGDRGPYRDEQTARDAIRRFVRERQMLEQNRSGKAPGSIEFSLESDARRNHTRVTPPRDVWQGRPDVD